MSFTYRPVKRGRTPLIIGLGGPTKSGKTYSAHELAIGLAAGGPVAMLNAEGAKGHQYADHFDYLGTDIEEPFTPQRYTEAVRDALTAVKPAVLIIDSMSHMHNGPGGMLEYHDAELDRLAGKTDMAKRDRMNWTAWIKPKAAENQFIYTLLGANCHVILCFRAKEKLKIITGKPPIDLGWQPIASDGIAFETIFTLMLPPHSKGVPDLSISEMRTPFDKLIPEKPLSRDTGVKLAEWAAGSGDKVVQEPAAASLSPDAVAALESELLELAERLGKRDEAAKKIDGRREHDTPETFAKWLEGQVVKARGATAVDA